MEFTTNSCLRRFITIFLSYALRRYCNDYPKTRTELVRITEFLVTVLQKSFISLLFSLFGRFLCFCSNIYGRILEGPCLEEMEDTPTERSMHFSISSYFDFTVFNIYSLSFLLCIYVAKAHEIALQRCTSCLALSHHTFLTRPG
jgi:hypothetical protein